MTKRIIGKRYGEFDKNMLTCYLRHNGARVGGNLATIKARVMLHHSCSSLPLLYIKRYRITPSKLGLFLQAVAEMNKKVPNIWKHFTKASKPNIESTGHNCNGKRLMMGIFFFFCYQNRHFNDFTN